MENIKESLIRNDLKNIIKRTIFFNILFIGLLIILCFWNKTFIILVWIPIFPYIYINMIKVGELSGSIYIYMETKKIFKEC